MKKQSCRDRKGFSLAEAAIATLVLGIAAAGVLLPFTSGLALRAEGERRTMGAKLASDLMEKVISDHLNDVNIVAVYNYTEAQGLVKDTSWTVFTDLNYAKFSRIVTCADAWVPQEEDGQAKFILATVQVKYDGKDIAIINRLISK